MDEHNIPLGANIHQTANCIDCFISYYLSHNSNTELTAMEGMTLKSIYKAAQPVFAKDIMRVTRLSKATTSQTLSSLVRKGLVKMTEKEDDKRSKIITLTDKGRETILEFDESFAEITAICEKGFSEEERQQLLYLLGKIRNNVSINKNEVNYGKSED